MKRFLFMVLCLSSILLLCAWGEKKVELLDDRKLIDLDKAIEFAKPGADSFTDTEGESEDEPSYENQEQVGNEDNTIIITISNESVKYNGNTCPEEEIENLLRRDHKENVKFSLNDDFAEAHVYKRVLKTLEKLHDEIGLEFSQE